MQNFKSIVRITVNNDEVNELQSRLAFQEDLLNSLNALVARQGQDIASLQAQVQHVYKKMTSQATGTDDGAGIDEPPPHY